MKQSRILIFCMSVASAVLAGAPTGVAEQAITIARSDCELAVRYAPPPDVAYQPGVDVNGRPVVPADVDGDRRLQLPETIPLIITDDLRTRFGLPDDSPLFDSNAFVGVVALRLRDRRLTFNGVELSDRESYALSAICRDAARHP